VVPLLPASSIFWKVLVSTLMDVSLTEKFIPCFHVCRKTTPTARRVIDRVTLFFLCFCHMPFPDGLIAFWCIADRLIGRGWVGGSPMPPSPIFSPCRHSRCRSNTANSRWLAPPSFFPVKKTVRLRLPFFFPPRGFWYFASVHFSFPVFTVP